MTHILGTTDADNISTTILSLYISVRFDLRIWQAWLHSGASKYVWNHTISISLIEHMEHGISSLWVMAGRSVKRPLSAWVPLINGLLPVWQLCSIRRAPTPNLLGSSHTLLYTHCIAPACVYMEVTQFTAQELWPGVFALKVTLLYPLPRFKQQHHQPCRGGGHCIL